MHANESCQPNLSGPHHFCQPACLPVCPVSPPSPRRPYCCLLIVSAFVHPIQSLLCYPSLCNPRLIYPASPILLLHPASPILPHPSYSFILPHTSCSSILAHLASAFLPHRQALLTSPPVILCASCVLISLHSYLSQCPSLVASLTSTISLPSRVYYFLRFPSLPAQQTSDDKISYVLCTLSTTNHGNIRIV